MISFRFLERLWKFCERASALVECSRGCNQGLLMRLISTDAFWRSLGWPQSSLSGIWAVVVAAVALFQRPKAQSFHRFVNVLTSWGKAPSRFFTCRNASAASHWAKVCKLCRGPLELSLC